MVPQTLLYYIQETWLFLFLISIIFIFIIIFRDLKKQTRKRKTWYRRSYRKTIARVTLTFQHFSRRGELLSTTSQNICQSVKKDMITFLKVKYNYSDDEISTLLKDKVQLKNMFPEKQVAEFMFDPNLWLKSIEPKKSIIERFFGLFKTFFKIDKSFDEHFYIELALVIRYFRKTFE
ncbi:MAG: hypothetical protein FK733_17220 [Asgard group archaeon]|nr:hypothetical protein [Asgard group archaeon]